MLGFDFQTRILGPSVCGFLGFDFAKPSSLQYRFLTSCKVMFAGPGMCVGQLWLDVLGCLYCFSSKATVLPLCHCGLRGKGKVEVLLQNNDYKWLCKELLAETIICKEVRQLYCTLHQIQLLRLITGIFIWLIGADDFQVRQDWKVKVLHSLKAFGHLGHSWLF